MKHVAPLTLVIAAAAVAITTVSVAPVEAAGRYKKEGNRCVWDANDSGADQCRPNAQPR